MTKQKRPCEEKLANPTGQGRWMPTTVSGPARGFCLLKGQVSKFGKCHGMTFTMNCCYTNNNWLITWLIDWLTDREQTFESSPVKVSIAHRAGVDLFFRRMSEKLTLPTLLTLNLLPLTVLSFGLRHSVGSWWNALFAKNMTFSFRTPGL